MIDNSEIVNGLDVALYDARIHQEHCMGSLVSAAYKYAESPTHERLCALKSELTDYEKATDQFESMLRLDVIKALLEEGQITG